MILFRRKNPKIKLPLECRQYYSECELLLFPLAPDRIYKATLERVERFLSERFSQYKYNKSTGQKDPLQPYYVGMFERNVSVEKYRIWALYYVKQALGAYMRTTLVTDPLSNTYKMISGEFERRAKTDACPLVFLEAWEEYEIIRERKLSTT